MDSWYYSYTQKERVSGSIMGLFFTWLMSEFTTPNN